MKGSLVKRKDRWDLYNISDGSKIASTAPNPFGKLSVINCESIEKGYSIEEIDTLFKKVPHTVQNEEDYWKCRAGFITGFQTAMELMGDKKFTERDVLKVVTHVLNKLVLVDGFDKQYLFPESIYQETTTKCKLLQQKEWDVEIVQERILTGYEIVNSNPKVKGSGDKIPKYETKPKLDEKGCLILKRVEDVNTQRIN